MAAEDFLTCNIKELFRLKKKTLARGMVAMGEAPTRGADLLRGNLRLQRHHMIALAEFLQMSLPQIRISAEITWREATERWAKRQKEFETVLKP